MNDNLEQDVQNDVRKIIYNIIGSFLQIPLYLIFFYYSRIYLPIEDIGLFSYIMASYLFFNFILSSGFWVAFIKFRSAEKNFEKKRIMKIHFLLYLFS